MPRKFWWPTSLAEQLVLMTNFLLKIGSYETKLPLTAAQVAAAEALCQTFIGAFNSTEAAKQTMQAMTQWRTEVFYGEPEGDPAPDAPVFPVGGAVTYTRGTVTQFFALRELIVASPGYTDAIGEDLGIVGAESSKTPEASLKPEFKTVTAAGTWINVTGSMKGMDAMRVEYAPKNGEFRTVAFLTNTPGGFQVATKEPDQPENGQIRAVYIKKNADVGSWSANYPVTLS
ncbi:MAG: hypothetical protein WBO10_08960 [Pyrinomonadaceae bacterium]